ncbi:MAG: radical SAM protein [Pseudomonadota bacterium]
MVSVLYLMPTRGCNCRCTYCYVPDRSTGGSDSLLRQVVDRFVTAQRNRPGGRPELRFVGGEPYVKDALTLELSQRFLEQCDAGLVVVNTNGTLVTQALRRGLLAPFATRPERLVHVVSLDGPAHIHDPRRPLCSGESSYESTLEGLRALLSHGFPAYVNMVLDTESVHGLETLMGLIKDELGMCALSVSLRYVPGVPMTVDSRIALLVTAYRLAAQQGIRLTGHHRLLLGRQIPELACHAGEKTMLATAEGELHACQRFVGRERPLGFVGDDVDFDSQRKRCFVHNLRLLAATAVAVVAACRPDMDPTSSEDRRRFARDRDIPKGGKAADGDARS